METASGSSPRVWMSQPTETFANQAFSFYFMIFLIFQAFFCLKMPAHPFAEAVMKPHMKPMCTLTGGWMLHSTEVGASSDVKSFVPGTALWMGIRLGLAISGYAGYIWVQWVPDGTRLDY